ncbi:putative diphthamide synthesis protein-domain-containing protein [Pelagophyceae sp. CCMP2097]|nr:putative diphthamide synthesis protein-domain-containing protein [Pelagophyceae sp. CCMP2097]
MAEARAARSAYFEYARVAAAVLRLGAKRVALQFDDAALDDSPLVVWELADRLDAGVQLFVLGDPAPEGAVDAVQAAHVDADLIVHYGDECLHAPPEASGPVLYCLGTTVAKSLDAEKACAAIVEKLDDAGGGDEAGQGAPVLLLYATKWRDEVVSLGAALGEAVGCAVSVARLPPHVAADAAVESSDVARIMFIGGLDVSTSTHICDEAALAKCRVVFVGAAASVTYRSLTLRCAECVSLTFYDPAAGSSAVVNVPRALTKRHHQIQRAAGASRWGVVVAAAGRVRLAASVAARCDAALKAAGRSSYVLALGVPSPSKIANFAELEAFVIVGADDDLVDELQRECAAPLITPNELAFALGDAEWLVSTASQPMYSSDLRDVPELDGTRPGQDDAPTFDFSRAGFQDTRRLALSYDDDDDDTVGCRDVVEFNSAAADFLAQRDWRGLEPQVGETPVARATEGWSGIASGYSGERSGET